MSLFCTYHRNVHDVICRVNCDSFMDVGSLTLQGNVGMRNRWLNKHCSWLWWMYNYKLRCGATLFFCSQFQYICPCFSQCVLLWILQRHLNYWTVITSCLFCSYEYHWCSWLHLECRRFRTTWLRIQVGVTITFTDVSFQRGSPSELSVASRIKRNHSQDIK